jgi:hypothetical protein
MEFPQQGHWQNFELFVFSPTYMEIQGSLHIYFNNGTNETDFTFNDASIAIRALCSDMHLNPSLARVTNLEFGVNVHPAFPASEIINQILCYKNIRPLRPYEAKAGYYFIEFATSEYFVKVYDKGKQYGVQNILRFEIKGRTNRYFKFAGVSTLCDLLNPNTMHVLGMKIRKVFTYMVFKDDEIEYSTLSRADQRVYLLMKDPNEWAQPKGLKTSTHLMREKRFKAIVEKFSISNYKGHLQHLIKLKIDFLNEPGYLRILIPKYKVNTAKIRRNKKWRRSSTHDQNEPLSHTKRRCNTAPRITAGPSRAP